MAAKRFGIWCLTLVAIFLSVSSGVLTPRARAAVTTSPDSQVAQGAATPDATAPDPIAATPLDPGTPSPKPAKPATTTTFFVDTGGHSGAVRSLALSDGGQILVTGSDDKTLRVWSAASGKTLRVLPQPIDAEADTGKIYAVAMSQAARLIAIAGHLGSKCPANCGQVRLLNFDDTRIDVAKGEVGATLDLAGTLDGPQSIVLSLAFSPDGTRLAAADASGTVVVWDVASRQIIRTISHPVRAQPGAFLRQTRAAFLGNANQIAVGGDDEFVRLYTVDTGKPLGGDLKADQPVKALAVSSDGRYIAAAGDGRVVNVWTTVDRQALPSVKFDTDSKIRALAFGSGPSKDHLAIGAAKAPFVRRVVNVRTGAPIVPDDTDFDNSVLAVAFSKDGKRLATSGTTGPVAAPPGQSNAMTLAAGSRAVTRISSTVDLKVISSDLGGQGGPIFGVGFVTAEPKTGTRGGSKVMLAWGKIDPCPTAFSCPEVARKLQFQIELPKDTHDGASLVGPEPYPADWQKISYVSGEPREALLEGPPGKLGRKSSPEDNAGGSEDYFRTLLLGAKVIAERGPDQGKDHLAYTLDPEFKLIFSAGRNGELGGYDLDGRRVLDFVGHLGDVVSLAVSPSGRLLASASTDETVRLWNAQTAELIVTLVPLNNGEWVMTTPQGYYTSSSHGDQYIGWQVDKGPNAPPAIFRADQLKKQFFRPDIVERALVLGSAALAIAQSQEQKSAGALRSVIVPTPAFLSASAGANLPPDLSAIEPANWIKITSPKAGSVSPFADGAPSGMARLVVDIKARANDPITELRVAVNGDTADSPPLLQSGSTKIDVPLNKGNNLIAVTAVSASGLTDTKTVKVLQIGDGRADKRDRLFIIAVGVNAYPALAADGKSSNLIYAAADAQEFVSQIHASLGPAHSQGVYEYVLYTDVTKEPGASNPKRIVGEPQAENIRDALKWLNATAKPTPNDTVVVFFAGHGYLQDGEDYVFLPTDSAFSPSGGYRNSIGWNEFATAFGKLKGRLLVFLDTCHSGRAPFNASLFKSSGDLQLLGFLATKWQFNDPDKEKAWEDGINKHGMFTWAAIEGLRGHWSNGQIRDVVRLGEFKSYLSDEIQRLSLGAQEPQFYETTSIDFVLSRP